jgi:hypothetical protein
MRYPLFDYGGQDCRHAERFRGLRQPDHVVHDQRRLVAVEVRELVRLVVDQDENRLFGAEKGIQAGLGHWVTPLLVERKWPVCLFMISG